MNSRNSLKIPQTSATIEKDGEDPYNDDCKHVTSLCDWYTFKCA